MLIVLDLIPALVLLRRLCRFFLTVPVDVHMTMALVGMLHPFHDLFLHRVHLVHHDDHRLVLPFKGIHHLVHPVLHGPAVGNDHIRLLHDADVLRRRLKGMAVHARRDHQGQLHLVSAHLAHKIIIGEQSGGHL